MKTLGNKGFLALFGAFALAACAESDLALQLDDQLTLEEQVELQVLADPGSFEAALEMADAENDVATELGNTRAADSRTLTAQARVLFNDALDAMNAGEDRAALAAARQARRLVARALRELGGDASLEALIERIEALAETADDDVFDNAAAVQVELNRIAEEARALLAAGDTVAAAARALLGEQIARHRRGRRDHPDIDVDHARLTVALAGTAVGLAERLISSDAVPVITAANTDIAKRQNRWLRYAKHLLAKSERALANGHVRRAVHFAQHAHWAALKAVILPGGIHEEELRALVEVAKNLFEQAEAGLSDDATELERRLLNHAGSLIERGIIRLEEGHVRGIAAVWRGAVICAWLIR